jgi:hypothetical protein
MNPFKPNNVFVEKPSVSGEQRSMKRSMRLAVKAKWGEIEKIRNKSSRFLESHGLTCDSVQALTMVISELIENSMKYGKFTPQKNKVTVDIHVAEDMVITEIINPIDETAYKHLKELDKTIQWIRGYQDPFQAYAERLKTVSKKPLSDEESGLGLTRIAYEGKAILDFFLGEDDLLNVSAVANY